MVTTSDRFGRLSIIMHWITLVLLVAVYACIELRELYARGSEIREALKTWHYMLGLSVFFLVWVRIGGKRPVIPSSFALPA